MKQLTFIFLILKTLNTSDFTVEKLYQAIPKEIMGWKAEEKGTCELTMGMTIGLKIENMQKIKVVLIRDKEVLGENSKHNTEIIQQMVDDAVMTLMEKKSAVSAWSLLVQAEDIVGIKTNVWRYLPTPPELEQAIIKRLLDVGVKQENIGISDWDVRTNPVFQKATALINARPLRSHYWAGTGDALGIISRFQRILLVTIPIIVLIWHYYGNYRRSKAKLA
jgi:hypothetical protein